MFIYFLIININVLIHFELCSFFTLVSSCAIHNSCFTTSNVISSVTALVVFEKRSFYQNVDFAKYFSY